MPEEVLVMLRWRDPDALLQTIDAWSPSQRVGAAPWWQAWVASFAADIDPAGSVEGLIVLDQSVEPPVPSWALSFALRETPRLAPAAPGASVPLPSRAPNGWVCEPSQALGVASRRWVCAGTERELARLVPAVTRAAPLVPLNDSAFTATLNTKPLTRLDLGQLKRFVDETQQRLWPIDPMNERIKAQLGAFSEALRDELVFLLEDLNGAVVDLRPITGEPALSLQMTIPAPPSHSRAMRMLLGSGAAGLVPNSLWEVHRESQRASFWWSFDAAPLAELREPLGALLQTVLDFRGLPWRLQLQAQRLVENMPVLQAPLVFAEGQRRELPADPGKLPAESQADGVPSRSAADAGWWLCQTSGDLALYRRYAEELERAFGDPVLGPQLVRLMRSSLGDGWAMRSFKQRAPRHRGLVPGSFVLELELKPAPGEAEVVSSEAGAHLQPGPKRYLIVAGSDPAAPVDGGLKLAWGDDEAFLTTLVAGGRQGLKHTDTLAAREGLSELVRRRALFGGFSNLQTWLRWFGPEPTPAADGAEPLLDAHPALNLPHGALSPILYSVSPGTSDQDLVFDAKLGLETLEDVKVLVTSPAEPQLPGRESREPLP
jgi:hypothetical protein